MLFNSEQYLFFLPLVVAVTWALRPAWRPAFLLIASYYFYATWNPPFLALIVGLTAANYLLGTAQGRRTPRSSMLLILALVVNLGTLAVFKYAGFFEANVLRTAQVLGLDPTWPLVQLVLPLGLSFFAFEFIHYQVDLYRGTKPIPSVIRFALFPAFFPTQIAGPIKRYEDFDSQVVARPRFDAKMFLEGIELIALGLFKKVALADTLLPIAGAAFADPSHLRWIDAWAGLIAFSFQIYLDFSGYTDIGRGSAQLLGYRIPINFRAPYLATSFQDFWRRWHISLSSWLRDYLYISLGGNRKGERRTYLNLIITMALGGLWHGAAWQFVIWGLGHGTALAADRFARPYLVGRRLLQGLPGTIAGWALTQLVVLLLWAMFRASDAGAALTLIGHLIARSGVVRLSTSQHLEVLLIAGGVLGAQLLLKRWNPRLLAERSMWGVAVRPAYVFSLGVAALVIPVVLATGSHRFIYFQF